MKLRYDLTGTGWADCTIAIGEATATVTASYLSDALDDLVGAVVALLCGDEQSTASFAEEPGEYRWEFARKGPDGVIIRIRFLGAGSDNQPIFDAETRLRTLAGALLSELQRLLREYGADGYRQRWVLHDFPERPGRPVEGAACVIVCSAIMQSNESLKWTSARFMEVIRVDRLARFAEDQHCLAGESSLA